MLSYLDKVEEMRVRRESKLKKEKSGSSFGKELHTSVYLKNLLACDNCTQVKIRGV